MKSKNLYYYEKKYARQGYKKIAGLDEVGRGCWAGPLVVAAVILPINYVNNEINDSKTLSNKKRMELYDVITKVAIDYSIVFIDAKEVDKLNPKQASIIGMQRALTNLNHNKPDVALIDAENIQTEITTKSIIKGDLKSITIASASILAKVSRDLYMMNISKKYPQYFFEKHKGYGTLLHLKALKKYGPIIGFHRFSYKPIIKINKDFEKV